MKRSPAILKNRRGGGLGFAAISYIGVDYLRFISPTWHDRLQPALWTVLAIAAIIRVPFYKHWSSELRSAIPFIFAMLFLLSALLFEMVSVRSVTAVLGLDWNKFDEKTELGLSVFLSLVAVGKLHSIEIMPPNLQWLPTPDHEWGSSSRAPSTVSEADTSPLPDIGQWLLLSLNEKVPQTVVDILRARIIGLHHFLMLFIMLAFSVLFESVEAPGLGLGARYMFTMGIGRLLRAITFISTILPSPRPWCASARFLVPQHPHPWAQKYYVPYATDSNAIRNVINWDIAYADPGEYDAEFRPDWGSMSFLIDFLRPTAPEGSSAWYHLLKKASGGCNDLIYSGHMLVAVLTAMAWTEAYGGYSSAVIWIFVIHSAQREIRERHHYSVDVVVAIYVGIMLWKMTRLFWPVKDQSKDTRLRRLEKIQGRLMRAAKDDNIEEIRELLKEVEVSNQVRENSSSKAMWLFSGGTIIFTLSMVLLAFTLTSDG